MEELKHFFTVYKTLENKRTFVNEILGREQAVKIISDCIEGYNKIFSDKK